MRGQPIITGLLLAATSFHGAGPSGAPAADIPEGTIAFASLAPRGWDLYVADVHSLECRRLTDHPALDYNALSSPDGKQIAFVSEWDGNLELYSLAPDGSGLRRLTDNFALDDHPAWSPDGRKIAFVSTRQPAAAPGRAWNAVYVMNADGTGVKRLSLAHAADYSPAWSPGGDLIAFASGSDSAGGTDLFVMKPDGSDRRLVVKDGGWPSFAGDGRSLFFHSRRQGSWGVWRVNLDGSNLERITPPDLEAFTPRASVDGMRLVFAGLRGEHRQIELPDLNTRRLTTLTREAADHWNPSISPYGAEVVYHKSTPDLKITNVELWGSPPGTDFKLLRLAGAFPAFSPDGRRLALVGGDFSRLDLMHTDGSSRRTIYEGRSRSLFSTSWAHQREQIAFAAGGVFQGAEARVEVMAVEPDGSGLRRLPRDAGNNGFPAFSSDGKRLVFRSGRGGSKNLNLMNSDGSGLRQLTRGDWTDTMCDCRPPGS